MQIDARMHETDRARRSAVAVRRPKECAPGAWLRSRLSRPRCAPAPRGRANAVVALLLLLLLPLGLIHRSSTGACRYDHRSADAASSGSVSGVGVDTPASASAGQERIAADGQHDHRGSPLPLDGAAPSGCGPAMLAGPPAPVSAPPLRSALPAWRALSPLALAPPPPAPPPRLS